MTREALEVAVGEVIGRVIYDAERRAAYVAAIMALLDEAQPQPEAQVAMLTRERDEATLERDKHDIQRRNACAAVVLAQEWIAERDAKIVAIERERDAAVQRAEAAQADAASMRAALERCQVVCGMIANYVSLGGAYKIIHPARVQIETALSGAAGRDMLARVRRLEALHQAVRGYDRQRKSAAEWTADREALDVALAALDADGGETR